MEDLVAAPTPVTLGNGDVYLVSPLTARDFTTIFKKIKQERLSSILEAIPRSLPAKQREEIIKVSLQEMDAIDVQKESVWTDVEVLKLACWLGLRKKHPDLTSAQSEKLLQDENNMLKILEVLNPSPKNVEEGEEAKVEDEKKTSNDLK